ncbi:hexose phosphate transporter [Mycoplasma sp. HS2188]|uniref:hexose phosphate transporter n=1 Tax=Mycoplasma sp. HS2188 TaxID=2976765 RepID=UPI0021AB018A|nr:hexose phosphate transporter [Mycoplasma sp. HS2188]MCT4469594.1 MFS transporter [Mycoplasma sp. HS2188]
MNSTSKFSTSENKKAKFVRGLLLWAFISIGYLAFVANWGFAAGLNGGGHGDTGILGYFDIIPDANFTLINQATNWGITIGRGIGSILVAFLLAKLAHKYSTIVALSLTLFGIPAQYLPGNGVGYAFFIILRTIMAIGGTMLIILTQPVVANFFNKKQKSFVSQFGVWFYPLGTIIAIVPFVFAANVALIRDNWQIVLTVLSALNVVPLIVMVIFGTKFDVKKQEQSTEPKVNNWAILGKYLKTKSTYVWILLYGGFLVAVVFPTSFSIDLFTKISGVSASTQLFGMSVSKIIRIWFIIFLAAVFVGPITVGLWSKYNLKRRWFITAALLTGIVFYILSMLTFVFGIAKGNLAALIFFFIFAFITGLSLWGIQGVTLNLPHEYKDNNPKTIGWMFALIWGFGYIFFTIGVIIMAIINIIGVKQGLSAFNIAIIKFVVLVLLSSISVVGALMIKEPSPDAKTFPYFCFKRQSKSK